MIPRDVNDAIAELLRRGQLIGSKWVVRYGGTGKVFTVEERGTVADLPAWSGHWDDGMAGTFTEGQLSELMIPAPARGRR